MKQTMSQLIKQRIIGWLIHWFIGNEKLQLYWHRVFQINGLVSFEEMVPSLNQNHFASFAGCFWFWQHSCACDLDKKKYYLKSFWWKLSFVVALFSLFCQGEKQVFLRKNIKERCHRRKSNERVFKHFEQCPALETGWTTGWRHVALLAAL